MHLNVPSSNQIVVEQQICREKIEANEMYDQINKVIVFQCFPNHK